LTADLNDQLDDLRGSWIIDPIASRVTFAVRYALLGRIHGRFTDIEGLLDLRDDITRCSALLTIDANSVVTGPRSQDEWLRSAAFLDAATFPAITFQSTQVRPHPNGLRGHAVITGDLTIRDITRSVRLTAQHRRVHAVGGRTMRAEFSGWAKVSRRDFDLGTHRDSGRGAALVGDQLTLALDICAVGRRRRGRDW
jgi:polyisoprenoid-binding protein YceI